MYILLISSVVISFIAMVWSILLLRRLRDWRIGFLTVMLGLIALRQAVTALAVSFYWDASFVMNHLALHGVVIGILALFTVIFLEIIIRQHLEAQKVLEESKENLKVAHQELKGAYGSLQRARDSAITAEKMAALGRVTSGACHEILNPVNNATCRLQLLIDEEGAPKEVLDHLRKIDEQLHRITKITRALVTFSNRTRLEHRPSDINDCVGRVVSLIDRDLVLSNISLDLQLAERPPCIIADKQQIQQVVLNLINNARDAMPDGGRLILTTEAVRSNGQKFVELRVQDTGEGISPEHMDRLFEPFFTTRPEGERAGLGLAVCHGIVEAHGGSILAENLHGGGAAFVVRLSAESDE